MADLEYEIDSTTTSTNSVDIIGLDDIDVDLEAMRQEDS